MKHAQPKTSVLRVPMWNSTQPLMRRNEMNRQLLLALMALFLSACATHSVRDDLPGSDLVTAKASMHRALAPRTLPNGKLYCAELAKTQDEMDACTGDLEDLAYQSENDKARGLTLFDKIVKALQLERAPCGWLKRHLRPGECTITP